MNTMEIMDPVRPVKSGGYKVDVSRGERNGRVSSEWFNRPDDERYLSLDDLWASVKGRSERSRSRVVETAEIRVEASRDSAERLHLVLPKAKEPVAPTHWAFGQLASIVGAPASYLRQLPAPLAGINLQYGLSNHRAEQVKTFETEDGRTELRAVTGPDYGRIHDHELVEAVQRIAGNGTGDTRWKVPGVLDWSTGVYNPDVEISRDTTTLYASDRDVFLFLVDDHNPIEAGRLADGSPDLYFRGFYCWNSEVGAKTLGIASFYLRAVCQNRNLWGVEDFQEITIRHSKYAASRFAHEAAPALTRFANSSAQGFVNGIKAARQQIVARTDEDRDDFLRKRGFSKAESGKIIEKVLMEEGRPPESILCRYRHKMLYAALGIIPRSVGEVVSQQRVRAEFAQHNYSPPGHNNPRKIMTEDTIPLPARPRATTSDFSPEDAVNAFLEPMRATTTHVVYGCAARHFLCWLKLQGILITAVDDTVLRRFAGHDCSCPRYSADQVRDPYYINRVRRFVRFLEDRGDIPIVSDLADMDRHFSWYAEHLASLRYNRWSLRKLNSAAQHFALWLQASRIGWHDVNAAVIERFAHHDCGCAEGRKRGAISQTGIERRRRGASRFFAFLRESGGVATPEPVQTREPVLETYGIWLHQHRGATEKSIERYVSEVARWLPELGLDPSGYEASALRALVMNQPASRSRASIRMTATVLRSFLRFQSASGRCRPELQQAVPSVAPYRLSTLPRYADQATIDRIIAACGTDTPARIRDRAIILLLARLGLRAGDVWLMRITDIDWQHGLLRVHGKGRRSNRLPLPQDAGDAVATYLEQARPVVAEERLFLRLCAPFTPLASSSEISGILARHLARAGITGVPSGAHMFRHSLATRLLRHGAGLEAVGAVLRHRSPDTTAIYAKVDIPMLQKIAQPWPGDLAC